MNLLYIFLDTAAPAQGGSGSLLWMIIFFVIIWILMMRPQRKQAKAEQKFRSELKSGDRIMFSDGIYGKVHEVSEHTVAVEISNGVIVTVEKSTIRQAPEEKK